MHALINDLEQTLTKPFTTDIPFWKLLCYFVIFVTVAYIVVDNLAVLKKGLTNA